VHTNEYSNDNYIHQLLAYTDGVHLFSEDINITKRNTETGLQNSKEDGLGINEEKSKYIFRMQDKTFQNVAKFKH
jgi:hypothetical protein